MRTDKTAGTQSPDHPVQGFFGDRRAYVRRAGRTKSRVQTIDISDILTPSRPSSARLPFLVRRRRRRAEKRGGNDTQRRRRRRRRRRRQSAVRRVGRGRGGGGRKTSLTCINAPPEVRAARE